MFLLNSRLGLFSAACLSRHPFSRSYGVILPSSLTTLLPSALGFSPHLPVSVCGTGTYKTIAAFLGSLDSGASLLYFDPRHTSAFHWTVFPTQQPLCLHQFFLSWLSLSSCVPTVLFICGTRISTSCPSATAFALTLGPDLPREDQLYSGNLRYSAEKILTSLSLLIPAFSLLSSPLLLTVQLLRPKNAPLPLTLMCQSTASVACFSPGHFRRKTSRLVSYYALFECMAASKPTS